MPNCKNIDSLALHQTSGIVTSFAISGRGPNSGDVLISFVETGSINPKPFALFWYPCLEQAIFTAFANILYHALVHKEPISLEYVEFPDDVPMITQIARRNDTRP